MKEKITIYTSKTCPYCNQIKDKLKESSIEFIEKDIVESKEEWTDVVSLTNNPITPTIKKQQLPKWFKGELYEEGAVVRNRFGGEEIELNNVELSMYDFVIGSSIVMEMSGGYKHTNVNELRKGLDWFRKNNPEAYMVLLD